MNPDRATLIMVGGIVALLALSSLITAVLKSRQPTGTISPVIANLDARVRAWWVMVAIFSAARFKTVAARSRSSLR